MPFKVKIYVLLLLAILVTIGTAWLSVNHFISGYIRTQATQNINEQIALVKEKLAGDINQKILLAANLNFGVTNVKKTLEETGFHNIVKVIGDMAFDVSGVINDTARVDALRKLIPEANNRITVSPLQQLDGKPVISILVPRGADSAYLYYLDMSEFKRLLEKVSGEGRYFSLADGQGNVLYSSKPQGESESRPNQLDIRGSSWTLTGYVDLDYIRAMTQALNGKIVMALLAVAVLVLVLAGVAVSALLGAGISLLKLLADPYTQLPSITFWLLGGLNAVVTDDLWVTAPLLLVGLLPLVLLRWRVNLLSLGDEEASALGVAVTPLRWTLIAAATLCTAAAVSLAGIIGWVGLVVPHIARLLVGADFRRLLPASLLLGASFLLAADTLARTLAPIELPLGILTAFVGVPCFLLVLARSERRP